jgi:hypothetical protein
MLCPCCVLFRVLSWRVFCLDGILVWCSVYERCFSLGAVFSINGLAWSLFLPDIIVSAGVLIGVAVLWLVALTL